jgi:hypothetical protein
MAGCNCSSFDSSIPGEANTAVALLLSRQRPRQGNFRMRALPGRRRRSRFRQRELRQFARQRERAEAPRFTVLWFVQGPQNGTLRTEFCRGGRVTFAATPATRGAVAQLGERLNGIQEVDGSIPFGSTKFTKRTEAPRRVAALFVCLQDGNRCRRRVAGRRRALQLDRVGQADRRLQE